MSFSVSPGKFGKSTFLAMVVPIHVLIDSLFTVLQTFASTSSKLAKSDVE
jgi:hypothetical protein